MKRGPNGSGGSDNLIRTTIFFPPTIDENLGVLALQKGTTKSDLVREATRELLKKENLNPDKKPIIEIKVAY